MTEAHTAALRDAGWPDDAIVQIIAVVSLFSVLNRLVNALGIEADPAILTQAVAARLGAAVTAGRLPAGFPVADRAAIAADFVLANARRARAGADRDDLARHAAVCARAVRAP